MNLRNKWALGLLSLGAAAVVGIAATTAYSSVYAQTETPEETPLARQERVDRGKVGGEEQSAILAEVLGISEEELQAAVTTATNSLIDQAVADGRITQEQADEMKAREEGRGIGRGPRGAGDEFETALAGVLGITVEELEAARDEVKDRVIEEAVASGEITQEQADLMIAREAMREYQRQQQRSDYEAAVAQAVTDGVITQEQADLLLSEENAPFFGPEMRGGHHGGRMGGHGGPDHGPDRGPGRGQPPADSPRQPEEETPDSSNVPLFPPENNNL
jgi:polyhydroxyalkanoate synthesis regulator phasin